jgi:hypothetical protein
MNLVLAAVLGFHGTSPLLRAAADGAVGDWASLSGAVMDQKVEIRPAGEPVVRGTVTQVTEEAIELRSGKRNISIARADVEQIGVRQKANRLRNALLFGAIGVGVAAAIGLGIVAGTGGSDDVAGVVALPIALGGAAGVGLGAAAPGGYRVVYRR